LHFQSASTELAFNKCLAYPKNLSIVEHTTKSKRIVDKEEDLIDKNQLVLDKKISQILNEINADDLKSFFTDKVEPKLVQALTEHFACPVKIRVPANIKTMHPVTVEYIVLVESDGEDYQETVTLNETWLY
jgi:Na+-transporting NADH:ubiquinone oxidoreductase subunit NqrC